MEIGRKIAYEAKAFLNGRYVAENADEVFITSSRKEIVPVVEVDENLVGDERVGEVTKKQ